MLDSFLKDRLNTPMATTGRQAWQVKGLMFL